MKSYETFGAAGSSIARTVINNVERFDCVVTRDVNVRLVWVAVRILYEILCDQHTYYHRVFEEAVKIENPKQACQTIKFFLDMMMSKRELKNTSSCKNILKLFILGTYVAYIACDIYFKKSRFFFNFKSIFY